MKTNKGTYIRLVNKTIREIARVPKDQVEVVERIQKKLQKYFYNMKRDLADENLVFNPNKGEQLSDKGVS